MKANIDRQEMYETYEEWIRVQLEAIGNFLDTHDTGELKWVVENTKCRVCRIHAKTALVLYKGGHEELAMRNLEFSIEALKEMLDQTKKEVANATQSR